MAYDKSGAYHMNPQRAAHADKMSAMGAKPLSKSMSPKMDKMEKGGMMKEDEPKGEMSSTWNQHEDGTHSTDHSDGESMEHPSAKEALSHMAMKHGHSDLADHIMMHDDGENQGDQEQEMPMPSHGHMLAGL